MIPWNPIHRYSGMTSHFDSLDEETPAGAPQARIEGWSDPVEPAGPERPPLGFVDVRAQAFDGEGTEHGADDELEGAPDVQLMPVGDADVSEHDADDKVSFFKREISFGRKKAKHGETSELGVVAADAEEAVESPALEGETADEKVPFFKREIGFGRRKHEDDEQAEHAEPAPAEEAAPVEAYAATDEAAGAEQDEAFEDVADDAEEKRVPFFKRELSFRRKDREDDGYDAAHDPIVIEVESAELEATAPQVEDVPEPVAAFAEADDPAAVFDTVEEPAAIADEHPAAYEPQAYEPQAPAPVFDVADEHGFELPVAQHDDTLDFDLPAQDEHAGYDLVADEVAPMVTASSVDDLYAEHVAVDETSEAEIPPVLDTTPVESKTPLHKRELSFGKGRKTGAQKNRGTTRRAGQKVVGLKIGASQLAAAVVQRTETGHELIELARTPLEPGIVLDGEIRDSEALVEALRSFFSEQKLPTRDVRIGVASNRIGVRTLDIAGIDDESRFDNAVRFKAHEVLPIAVSDSVLDYRVLEERIAESGEAVRKILLVVAPRDQVAPYLDVAQRAGLRLAGIDLEALGLLRAFVEPGLERTAGGTSTVVVSIGHEATTLLVSGGGVCEFTRVFDWGGATLQDAIAQELQVHPMEAATILRHLSLSGNSRRVEGIDEEATNRALEAVRLRLTPFARELVSSLQFYQTQPDSLGIGEIVITGGTSQLDGLAEALNQMIGVAVRVGNPLQRVGVRNGADSGFEQALGSLAVPIGLAIDDEGSRTVDLTPRDVASQRRRVSPAPILIPAAAVIPLAALGFLFSQAHGKVSDKQAQLNDRQAQLAQLPQPTGPQVDIALQGAEAARASAVAQVLASRTAWDSVFRDLSRVLPDNVWLTGLKASVSNPLSSAAPVAAAGTDTAAAAAAAAATSSTPTGVTITGYTFTQPDVAALLSRLVALPTLDNVQLTSSQSVLVGKKDVVQFTILANLRGVGGGA